MTLDFGDRKLRIIQAIMDLKDDFSIRKIEKELASLDKFEVEQESNKSQEFWDLVQPVKNHITIEEMIEQQNYKPIEREAFFAKAKKIDIQEPIEDLLAMLTK
jgi:hypothetical protein